MPPGDRLPPDTVDAIVALYAAGLSRRAVAERTAVAPTTVTAVLRARGERVRPPGGKAPHLPHFEFERTARMYRAGASEQEVAEVLGVSRGAVQWRLEQAGVARRSRAEANLLAVRRDRGTGRGPTIDRGERHWNAKLTRADADEIRRRAGAGETQAALAREYGVTPANVSSIVTGKTWVADDGNTR